MTHGTLVVVPCGLCKIWDRDASNGPTPARDAYVGSPFKVNRQYAETFGERWVILSAKYGFIDPDFVIPGPYNVTFRDSSTGPIAVEALTEQVVELGLHEFAVVIGLGGRAYCAVLVAALASFGVIPHCPFVGLPIGKAMAATRRAIALAGNGLDQGQVAQVPDSGLPRGADFGVGPVVTTTIEHNLARKIREGNMLPPSTEDFDRVLQGLLASAQRSGESHLDVNSGELHRLVGGYPGPNHRMPICCGSMRKAARAGDLTLQEPPRGRGASLTIRYRLPR